MEKVTIVWSGPYSIDSARNRFRGWEDFGIYMITRKWGEKERIIYIGLVYWRTFADRIAEHERDWLWALRGQIRVRVGKIQLKRGKKHSIKRTEDIENLLIYAYQPEYNEKGKAGYYGREIEVVNRGRRGPLDEIVYSEDYR